MMLMDLKELPEQKRVIVRSALQRINDISNSLLEKSKAPPAGSIPAQSAPSPVASTPAGAREVVLLSSMVGELLSEKRIQFREKMGVSIEEDLTKAYGYFASVNATELKRVLSNLINNSIEAFPEGKGRVTVGIRGYKDVVQIIISDNGKGIPASVLAKLGERGVSHGKESSGTSGSGLGVYHAKSTVESCGGKFEIQSREGQGTMIQIQLPRASAPDWFVEELRLKPDMSVFSVDDDQSIHGIWSERLEAMKVDKQRISLLSYTSAKAFVDICEGLEPQARANALFLVDYEFLNQGVNGLQVIERLGIASQAILVTSRYEEVDIQKKCQGMGVKLIPKALAGYVPIVVE
jgi:anti-sigma regulatory factor (Ser/Thr protein kinase)